MERYKVVLVEGLDGVGKSTLVARLAAALGAARLATPPKVSLEGLPQHGDTRAYFDAQPEPVRRAYYRFGNLVVSELARAASNERPVVIDRYWPSTVAFAAGADPEQETAQWLGKYPSELLVPDVTILLTASEEARRRRMRDRGQPQLAEERALEAQEALRRRVTAGYMAFAPRVIDTSGLDPDEVLAAALALVGP